MPSGIIELTKVHVVNVQVCCALAYVEERMLTCCIG
eukprot:SAG31_NODE_5145_length_2716_cov_1.567826_6_plen_36_part_00